MAYLSEQQCNQFEKDGFLLVKSVFSQEEVKSLREAGEQIRLRERNTINQVAKDLLVPGLEWFYGDILSKSGVDWLVTDPRVLGVVRSIIGEEVVYWGDSTFQFGRGYRGFHKDCVDRNDPSGGDWRGKYDVVRVGIYLQNHERYSGSIKMRIGSHLMPGDIENGRAYDVPSQAGDLVIWKLTTTHSGNVLKCRLFPSLTMPNFIERRMPSWLAQPEEKERMTALLTYARPGEHLDRYVQYCVNRGDYHVGWRRSRFDAEAKQRLEKSGVRMFAPISDYGSEYIQSK